MLPEESWKSRINETMTYKPKRFTSRVGHALSSANGKMAEILPVCPN